MCSFNCALTGKFTWKNTTFMRKTQVASQHVWEHLIRRNALTRKTDVEMILIWLSLTFPDQTLAFPIRRLTVDANDCSKIGQRMLHSPEHVPICSQHIFNMKSKGIVLQWTSIVVALRSFFYLIRHLKWLLELMMHIFRCPDNIFLQFT